MILSWDRACSRLSDYIFNRINMFEREQETNQEIADWLRRLARKIDISTSDINFKNSTNMPYRAQIELALAGHFYTSTDIEWRSCI